LGDLRGPAIVLRPLRTEEFDAVREAQQRMFPIDQPTPATDRRLRRRIERSGQLVDGWLDLAIEVDGRLVGDIGARRPNGALPPGVYELGISLFDEADRGKGYGAEATELLTGHLFEAHGAERVQATTAVTNTAMRRVLEKLGFAHEGTLRAFMHAENGREDYAMYAVTRDGWVRRGNA
jgi:ribosomal-protein-alanine N-acetyltransferase